MRVPAAATICSVLLLSVVAQTAAAAPPNEASLQKALDRVVAAGVPGAVLLVRDGDRTIRLASGYAGHGRTRPRAAERPLPHRQRHEDVRVDRRPPARRRGEAEARRHGRARAAGQAARRRRDHRAPAPAADERSARLPRRPADLPPVPDGERSLRLDAVAGCSRSRTRTSRTSAPARSGSTRTRTTSCSA